MVLRLLMSKTPAQSFVTTRQESTREAIFRQMPTWMFPGGLVSKQDLCSVSKVSMRINRLVNHELLDPSTSLDAYNKHLEDIRSYCQSTDVKDTATRFAVVRDPTSCVFTSDTTICGIDYSLLTAMASKWKILISKQAFSFCGPLPPC